MSDEEKEGSFIDIKGARIFGSRWYRHSLNAMIAPMITGIQENSNENRSK